MKRIANFITKQKIIVIAIIAILTVLSLIFMGKVTINYNINDYLPSNTGTSMALEVIEDEFGMNSNIQVMVKNITKENANNLKDDLNDIKHVVYVNFDSEDTSFYKDNTALFTILVDDDEYSDIAIKVKEDVEEIFNDKYDVTYGGNIIEKQKQKQAITEYFIAWKQSVYSLETPFVKCENLYLGNTYKKRH